MQSQKHIGLSKPKIVLICMDLQRDLSTLELLKKEFENTLQADIWIIGSLADVQKIYYLLNKIKPNMVFISQIIEKVTRDIASYVRKSGAILCVLPCEFTYSKADYYRTFNNNQPYDKYVDYYFMTGLGMHKAISKFTDIDKNKMFTTGTPKMDLYKNIEIKKSLTKSGFLTKYSIPKNRKNIFIFTNFITIPVKYVKSEDAYKGNVHYTLEMNERILEMRSVFVRDIKRLCVDFPKYNFILKTHPLENSSFYKTINIKNFHLVDNIIFNDVVKSIDLAIYWHSTVTTECWINGIKTLQYRPRNRYKNIISEFTPGNPVYHSYLDLRNGILKYLVHKLEKRYLSYQKKYLKLCYYKIDGQSVKRIAIKVKTILEKEPSNYPNYTCVNNKWIHLFIIVEKILGIRLSRRMVSFFRKGYDWRYAADNFIFSQPNNH